MNDIIKLDIQIPCLKCNKPTNLFYTIDSVGVCGEECLNKIIAEDKETEELDEAEKKGEEK